METKVKNREWVKNAAIIFLAVLLVLTFFSNTIMNRSLPEVATSQVNSGPIVAKVRGTGTVTASGVNTVKAKETRTIRSVMVKVGQEVNVGDVLVLLGEGDSTLLEQAQDTLRELQASYQRTAITMPTYSHSSLEQALHNAQNELDTAEAKYIEAEYQKNMYEASDENIQNKARIRALEEEIAGCEERIRTAQDAYNEKVDKKIKELEAAEASGIDVEAKTAELNALISTPDPVVSAETNKKAAFEAELENLNAVSNPYYSAYESALYAYQIAEQNLYSAQAALDDAYASDDRAAASVQVELSAISQNIAIQQEKIKKLAGEEGNSVTANVSGIIATVDCTAGDTVMKDSILCTIEVPDMGHTLSFSVTNEQAQRLRVGDTASISNFYWGNEIKATLTSIKTDPKNPQSNKLLTFDLEGNVTTGSELSLSVGQKSANYDLVVPNSSIRSDSNGSYVLAVNVKSSPLGNRYIAKRVSVEVLASDDVNSAVVADLETGDFVITTSSAPIKNSDQVRMADS